MQNPPTIPDEISPISIVDEMKTSFLDYAMSVIISRALPDVRDGLKPVHRRILYAAQEGGFVAGRPYKKSAKIVGDVMGNYHPHGDSAIYDALARMAQPWSMRVPLIDGQGNFGSMDPDPPASMRYTEARLAKVTMTLLADLDKDTVNFQPNYDASTQEPQVLPARYPNLLVNGAGGIAVAMATNIPPHNLGEVIRATLAMIDNPEIQLDALMKIIPSPDFPTGAIIMGNAGTRNAYATGNGSIMIRSSHILEKKRDNRQSIVLTSIPYQIGKSALIEKIALAARDKRIEGIADIRDESNREGVRIVLDLKRDATRAVVLNQLWRNTPAQSSFPANMLAIRSGRPETLSLQAILKAFIAFREEVITRRCKFELAKTRDRAHILLGLVIAVSNLDTIVQIIRSSHNPAMAREILLKRTWPINEIEHYIRSIENIEGIKGIKGIIKQSVTYRLSETQTKAILELRLHRLTALGRDEIGNELKILSHAIQELLSILADRQKLYAIIRKELQEVHDEFDSPRMTIIAPAADGIEDEDLIEREDMVVTVTLDGYIKRTALDTFRAQRRGGKGRAGMATKDDDVVTRLFVASTHQPMLFFSTFGKVYRMKTWSLPEGGPATRGRAMINLLPLAQGETISTMLSLPEDESEWSKLHIMLATAKGKARRNSMEVFTRIPLNGKIAMRFDEDSNDRLIGAVLLNENHDVLLASRQGKVIRFAGSDIREFQSRTSLGPRGMKLKEGNEVISLSILDHGGISREEREDYLRCAAWKTGKKGELLMSRERFEELQEKEQFILTICANGYGKLSSAYEYRRTGRGGQGYANISNIARNGPVVASFPAVRSDQLMLVTDQAKIIRMGLDEVRVIGRGSAGVRLFNVAKDEHVVSAALIEDNDGEDSASEIAGEQASEGETSESVAKNERK